MEKISSVRCFLKDRIQNDLVTFRDNKQEENNVYQLLQRTIYLSESNSLLIIGPRGCGKTVLINSVIAKLSILEEFQKNALVVYLNGNLHTNDRLALKAASVQMQLENVLDGKVFGSFAENLAFLLSSLKCDNRDQSRSIIFILEEFDLFCTHHNQTLLYNLFDVSQSAQVPISVIGLTCRLDVVELLEKRVKSRFSHRQIFIFPKSDDFEDRMLVFQKLLMIPLEEEMKNISQKVAGLKKIISFNKKLFDPSKYTFKKKFTEKWNEDIKKLSENSIVRKCMENIYRFDLSESFFKTFLFRIVAELNDETHPRITPEDIQRLHSIYEVDDKVRILCDLSVLELCVLIIIKHHSEIYDRDPFNFEIIFSRFMKFSKISSTMQEIERSVVLKAFEHLQTLELIIPLATTSCKMQKDFEMHKLALTISQINQAVSKYQALPTDVSQLAQSNLL